jgi:hypothetical protein
MPADQAGLDPVRGHNKRFSLIGRLMKFPPAGGVMDGHDDLPGQLWSRAGVSGLSPWNCGAECFGGQICLDADERIWTCDTFMYCLQAVDGAGNLIARVGRYGNADCPGGGGDAVIPGTKVIRDPEVPLARPAGVAVWRDRLFVCDMYAHRIVRCRLEYAQTVTAALDNGSRRTRTTRPTPISRSATPWWTAGCSFAATTGSTATTSARGPE